MALLLPGTLLYLQAPGANSSFSAAQVGVDKSSLLESQLQGHHSVAREGCLEFLNFILYWNSWQHGPLPLTLGEAWLPIHQHSHLTGHGATSPQGVQPSRRVHRHKGGRVASFSLPTLSQSCPKPSCFCVSGNTVEHSPMQGRVI